MSNRKPARWAALKEAALARPRARSSPLRRRSARRSSRGLQGRTRGAATAPADLTARDGAHGAAAERRGRPRTRSPARGPEAAARPQHLGLPAPRNGARRTDGRTDGPPRPPRPAPRRPHPRPPLPVPPETRMASNMEKQQSVQGNTKSDIQTFTPQGSQHGGGDNRGPKVTPRWLFPFLGVPLFSVLPFLHNIGMSPCKGSVPPPRPLSDPQAQLCLSLLGPPCAKSVFKRKLLKG